MTESAAQNNQVSQEQISQSEQVLTMWQIVYSQFKVHRAAMAGLIIIIFYVLIAVGAPLIQKISGLDPEAQNPLARYQKMFTTTSLGQDQEEDVINKFILENPEKSQKISEQILQKNLVNATTEPKAALVELFKLEQDEFNKIIEQLDDKKELITLDKSLKTFHLFGTDELGRDVLIRLVFGTRVSMGVGVLVALASALIGLLVGAFAGYHGGWIDTALMRLTDALLSLPTTPILIVIAAVDLDKIPWIRTIISTSNENVMKLVIILILFSWMQVARLVRASVLSLREREFILAAKTLGAKDTTIVFKHLFPNVIAPLLVAVTLGVGNSILYEAALSFLGLGIQPPTPSWGNMLFNAQELITEAPFLAILPGLQILMVVMSFNYLGDGLQDAIDPKAIRR